MLIDKGRMSSPLVAHAERRSSEYDLFDPHAPPPRGMSFSLPLSDNAANLSRLDTSAFGITSPVNGLNDGSSRESSIGAAASPLTPGFVPDVPTVGGEKVGKTSPVLSSPPVHRSLLRDGGPNSATRARSPRPNALSPRPNAGAFDSTLPPLPLSPTRPSGAMNPYDPPSLHSRKYHPDELSPKPLTNPAQPEQSGFYDSPAYWLIMYFCFNLGLTLFNKGVLVSFPFPYVSRLLCVCVNLERLAAPCPCSHIHPVCFSSSCFAKHGASKVDPAAERSNVLGLVSCDKLRGQYPGSCHAEGRHARGSTRRVACFVHLAGESDISPSRCNVKVRCPSTLRPELGPILDEITT